MANKNSSAIPLPELLLPLDDGNNYEELARRFYYNSVVIDWIPIKGQTSNQTTIYVPNSRILFHRYRWMSSLISPKKQDNSKLIAEVTVPKDKAIYLENIVKKIIDGLLEINVVKDGSSVQFLFDNPDQISTMSQKAIETSQEFNDVNMCDSFLNAVNARFSDFRGK
jgi:protoporphyrinogen oxidase